MQTLQELYDEQFDIMLINDVEVLFTPQRIKREIIPTGLYAYDIRESDTGDDFVTIERRVIVNHAGTILSKIEFDMGTTGTVKINEYGFEDTTTLQEWLNTKS